MRIKEQKVLGRESSGAHIPARLDNATVWTENERRSACAHASAEQKERCIVGGIIVLLPSFLPINHYITSLLLPSHYQKK